MSTNNKIDIEELRKAVNVLIDHLRDRGIHEIKLGKDYYWDMDAEKLYDATADPTEFGRLGSEYAREFAFDVQPGPLT